MASLAELPKLVGFFSYSREDDEDFRGELSAIRDAIGRNLAALLGRKKRQDFRLWQDVEAIAPGKLWETEIAKAIEESEFFIPIVTPRAVASPYCKSEFESFLARERALRRNDLVFPILYVPVPGLRDEARRRNDRVLTIVAERQFEDWSSFRHEDVNATAFRQRIGRFCEKIAETPHETWISAEERHQLEAEARRRAEEERALRPGDSFKECVDCPEMIVVPAGRFLMGSPAGQGRDNERPQHEVTIARPFAVAKFAVTFDEWDACAARGGCRPDVSDSGWGRGRRPAINVSWDDAQTYVKWLSGITGKDYRLLSEAEWEYAAHAGTRTAYPWGDDVKLDGKPMANCDGSGSEWSGKQTAPVGAFPANAFGLYDMVGNVHEWTEDCWNNSYQGAPADGSPWMSGDCRRHVIRGGSCYSHPDFVRSQVRGKPTRDRHHSLGFRVARTLSL
jgi:formylglycine-generating enzyme required for sulfatase activity